MDAQYNIGLMYLKGEGVPQNYVQAYKWISIARAKGDRDAINILPGIAGKMTKEQIAEAQRSAAIFWDKME